MLTIAGGVILGFFGIILLLVMFGVIAAIAQALWPVIAESLKAMCRPQHFVYMGIAVLLSLEVYKGKMAELWGLALLFIFVIFFASMGVEIACVYLYKKVRGRFRGLAK